MAPTFTDLDDTRIISDRGPTSAGRGLPRMRGRTIFSTRNNEAPHPPVEIPASLTQGGSIAEHLY